MSRTILQAGGARLVAGRFALAASNNNVSTGGPAGIDYTGTYFAKLATRGFTPSAGQRNAVQAYENSLTAAGVLNPISRAACLDRAQYLVLGAAALTHSINFIDPDAHELTFFGSAPQTANGIEWDGISYAATDIAANTLGPLDLRLSVYTRSGAAGSGDTFDMGAQGGSGTNTSGLFISTANALVGGRPFARLAGADQPGSDPLGPGLWSLRARTDPDQPGQNLTRFARNAAAVLDGGGMPAPMSDLPIYLGALNLNGTYGPTSRPACYYTIGRAYTDAQETAAYNAVQALQVALGRNV